MDDRGIESLKVITLDDPDCVEGLGRRR